LAALELIDYEPTLDYNAIPMTVMEQYRARWVQEAAERAAAAIEHGEEPEERFAPVNDEGEAFEMGTPDEEIGAAISVASVTDAKFDALAAHASQIGDSTWMKMGREEFARVMRTEWLRAGAQSAGTRRHGG
jgi:LmbE family N-acetylglucosaminyl deacetylase